MTDQQIQLSDFVERIERERPEELLAALVARVTPHPWVDRRGSGRRTRIRMAVGKVKYERLQADDIWQRVDEWTMGEAP